MKIEQFNNITIAYMRHIGEYGPKNKEFMETFKQFLNDQNLFNDQSVILGIALDNPTTIPANALRYDVGIIIEKDKPDNLNIRKIDDGKYAIFEVTHTAQEVQAFWHNIAHLTANLSIDYDKPIIERYAVEKINQHLCEFCIPLKS